MADAAEFAQAFIDSPLALVDALNSFVKAVPKYVDVRHCGVSEFEYQRSGAPWDKVLAVWLWEIREGLSAASLSSNTLRKVKDHFDATLQDIAEVFGEVAYGRGEARSNIDLAKTVKLIGGVLQNLTQEERPPGAPDSGASRAHQQVDDADALTDKSAVGDEGVFASATDTIPEKYLDNTNSPIGPLTGSGTALARALTGKENARRRELVSKHKNGVVWVRKISDRELEAYFRNMREFQDAEKRLNDQ